MRGSIKHSIRKKGLYKQQTEPAEPKENKKTLKNALK